jgi:hypothetical protein
VQHWTINQKTKFYYHSDGPSQVTDFSIYTFTGKLAILSIVVAVLRPLVKETSNRSSTTPPLSLYSEKTPIAELSFKAKKIKQIQNILRFHTMTATIKKQPDKFIMMIS